MNAARLALFAVVLAAVGGAAALAGRASGIDVEPDPAAVAEHAEEAGPSANGLSDTALGVRFDLAPRRLAARVPTPVRVSLSDEDGRPVVDLDEHEGEPPLHLILVRRDLGAYQHLHPRREGGAWTTTVTLPDPGPWRAYADFERDGEKVVLGRDLTVPGAYAPTALPAPSAGATAGPYAVELVTDDPRAGEEATLTFRVERGGRAVDDLQPYLGATGHLVAIREADLTYLHVHPLEDATEPLSFAAELAEPGRYALFLQFRHRDVVRTAAFTLDVAR